MAVSVTVKKGSSFRVAFNFTPEEWNSIFPVDYALSQAKIEGVYFPLEVEVSSLASTLYIKGDTDEWPLGSGSFDVKLIVGDLITAIPEMSNIPVYVVEGVTQ